MNNYLKYGIISIIVIFFIIADFILVPRKSTINENTTLISVSHRLNTSIKPTFNLTMNGSKVLFNNISYNEAISTNYINTHALEFYRFYSSLPLAYNITRYYGGAQVEVNLTENSKVFISKSYATIVINLNGYYGYIVVSGAHDKIYIANGLYTSLIENSVGAVNDSIIKIDAYSVS